MATHKCRNNSALHDFQQMRAYLTRLPQPDKGETVLHTSYFYHGDHHEQNKIFI